jgi:hypothetical protein
MGIKQGVTLFKHMQTLINLTSPDLGGRHDHGGGADCVRVPRMLPGRGPTQGGLRELLRV